MDEVLFSLSKEEIQEQEHLDKMHKAQLKAAQYNTPFLIAKSARQSSKEEVAEYRRLNKINLLHRNLLNISKDIAKLEQRLPPNLIATIGHKYRTTLRENYVLESCFETTRPVANMQESIRLLTLISAEQNKYCKHLRNIVAETKEDERAATTAKAKRGRITALMRITDHKRASRRHRKKAQPLVFDSWMSKIVDQKVSEVSDYSDVRQRII